MERIEEVNNKKTTIKSAKTGKKEMKLLVICTRVGFSSAAIEAAREAGGEGALVLEGRGVGKTEKKFFGLRIEPETEIVLMAVPEKDCLKIAKAVYAACPYTSDARGQVLVLPLSHYFF